MKSNSAAAVALLLISAFTLQVSADPKGWRVNAMSKGQAKLESRKFQVADQDDQGSQNTVKQWFEDFALEHNITYASQQEEAEALKNFREALKEIWRENEDANRTWWAGLHRYSEMGWEQFNKTMLMSYSPVTVEPAPADDNQEDDSVQSRRLLQSRPAKSVDWRSKGKVTPVRDQKSCGSCWTFAATATVESAYLIKFGNKNGLDLSEQELVNCVSDSASNGKYWSSGCNGGSASEALRYIANVNQTTEARWRYTASNGKCTRSLVAAKPGYAVRSSGQPVHIQEHSASALMDAVNKQPVAVYFSVQNSFYNYGGGVYNGNDCNAQVNHVMVVVGYKWTGSTRGSYWIVRNSWGKSWGENGYVRVAMQGDGKGGVCNMYTGPVAPALGFKSQKLA